MGGVSKIYNQIIMNIYSRVMSKINFWQESFFDENLPELQSVTFLMGKGVFGQPTLPNIIKVIKNINPSITFHPDKNLAENFHFDIAHPENSSPTAFESVPIPMTERIKINHKTL